MAKLNQFNCILSLCIFMGFLVYDQVHCADYLTEKPASVPSCKIYEPGFTKCSTNSIQKLMEYIIKGTPEITEHVGSIDPVKLDIIKFQQDNNQAATISANLTDIVIKGMNEVEIKESRVSKKDFSWQTKIFLPHLRLDANYKMSGKILIIPLNGAGKMFMDMERLDIVMHTKTRLYEKEGFTFYNVTEVRVNLDVGGLKSEFENIFNGNSKDVEKSTNEFFNTNWRDFYEALRPLILETIERTLQNILQKVFNFIPANFLVEDIPTSTQLYDKSSN